MSKELNILSTLKGFKVQPPAMLYDAIIKRVEYAKEVDNVNIAITHVKDFNPLPPSFLFDAIMADINNKKLSQSAGLDHLIEFKMPVPTFLFGNIQKEFALKSNKVPLSPVVNMAGFRRYGMSAAASILLCFMAGLIYKQFSIATPDDNTSNIAVVQPLTNSGYNNDPVVNDTTTAINPNNETIKNTARLNVKAVKQATTKMDTKTTITGELLSEKNVSFNGTSLPFIDNDFFATFASFNNVTTDILKNIPEGKDLIVRLNNYSVITISSKMQEMMKKMYKTKKNGKVPSSAKKLQKKLVDWKNYDNKSFDLDLQKNPLDAIDLLESVFDK